MVFNGHNHLFEAAMNCSDETVAWIGAHRSPTALRPGSLAAEVRWHLDGQPAPPLNDATRGLETLPVRAVPA